MRLESHQLCRAQLLNLVCLSTNVRVVDSFSMQWHFVFPANPAFCKRSGFSGQRSLKKAARSTISFAFA